MNTTKFIRQQHYSSSTVLTVVGILIFIGVCVYLYNAYKDFKNKLLLENGSITYSVCPDYWDTLSNNKCQNSKYLGKCSNQQGNNVMDFSGVVFTNNNTGNYAKCKWAKSCNITWSNIDRLC